MMNVNRVGTENDFYKTLSNEFEYVKRFDSSTLFDFTNNFHGKARFSTPFEVGLKRVSIPTRWVTLGSSGTLRFGFAAVDPKETRRELNALELRRRNKERFEIWKNYQNRLIKAFRESDEGLLSTGFDPPPTPSDEDLSEEDIEIRDSILDSVAEVVRDSPLAFRLDEDGKPKRYPSPNSSRSPSNDGDKSEEDGSDSEAPAKPLHAAGSPSGLEAVRDDNGESESESDKGEDKDPKCPDSNQGKRRKIANALAENRAPPPPLINVGRYSEFMDYRDKITGQEFCEGESFPVAYYVGCENLSRPKTKGPVTYFTIPKGRTYFTIQDVLDTINNTLAVSYVRIREDGNGKTLMGDSESEDDDDDDDDDSDDGLDDAAGGGQVVVRKKHYFKFSDVLKFEYCSMRRAVYIKKLNHKYDFLLDFGKEEADLLGFNNRRRFIIINKSVVWAEYREGISEKLAKRISVNIEPDMGLGLSTAAHSEFAVGWSGCQNLVNSIANFDVPTQVSVGEQSIVFEPKSVNYYPLSSTFMPTIRILLTKNGERPLHVLSDESSLDPNPTTHDYPAIWSQPLPKRPRLNHFNENRDTRTEVLLHFRPMLFNSAN